MKLHKIAIIGGTGKAGSFLVRKLIEKGYQIKLLLRNPENFPDQNPLIEIVKGDARDYDSVNELIKTCDTVISTIGQPKGEKSIFSESTKNVILFLNSNEIKRYIVITGLNVNTPFDNKNEKVKMATEWMYQNYPETTLDKQKEYELLTESNLDWTLVRLPLIIQTDESFATQTNLHDCIGENISANDLSEFLISQIDDKTYFKKSPFLYNL
ncbi:NAD(P)-dependent oxidoreductase [Epilithonimonas mollis]|uniref:Putative NADH-flavin reductase n=1 Tax=Epilithonimonas mollis TaxID=216903 RepID=A0A1M6T5X6_9FLAO|nr:NAD(P)H-binding protein [Epilithonimonas mollis]SHK52391.1 Putative NADH-flavin reductase [Epilithonimonas mollis]